MFYTHRLMVRGLDADADAKHLTRWLNNPEYLIAVAADCPKPNTGVGVRDEMLKQLSKETKFPHFAICKKPAAENLPENLGEDEDLYLKDGKSRYPMIGMLVFHTGGESFSWTNKTISFGLIFDKAYWNQGYGTELLRWACKYVFDSMGMHRFQLRVRKDNLGAIKCYQKVGFKTEGILRESYYYDGEWRDNMLMAMLEHEYRELQLKAS